jgi:hypothetical protein
MTHLIMAVFGSDEVFGSFGLWAFLSVGAVALFGIFIPTVTWIENRRKEREAFYKSEAIRRVAEASGEGAKIAMEMLKEENRQKQIRMLEGMKVGGVINIGVGLALVIFLGSLIGHGSGTPYLCGLIPGMVGVGMLVYVYVLARPVE